MKYKLATALVAMAFAAPALAEDAVSVSYTHLRAHET